MYTESTTEYLASPQEVTWHGYANSEENLNLYAQLSRLKTTVKVANFANSGFDLLANNYKYFVLDQQTNSVLFYVKVEHTRRSFNGNPVETASQLELWRDRSVNSTKTMPQRFFFDVLLYSTQLVLTDGKHTDSGRSFWENNLAEAFTNPDKYVVYSVDLNQKSLSEIDQVTFRNTVRDLYGTDAKYQAYRLAVGLR